MRKNLESKRNCYSYERRTVFKLSSLVNTDNFYAFFALNA
jgi:hypothetical protein